MGCLVWFATPVFSNHLHQGFWSLATEKKKKTTFFGIRGCFGYQVVGFSVPGLHEKSCKWMRRLKNLTILSWWQGSERQASSVSAGKAPLDPICTKTSNQLWIQTTDTYIIKNSGCSSKKNLQLPVFSGSTSSIFIHKSRWLEETKNKSRATLTPRTAWWTPTYSDVTRVWWQTAMAVSLC